MKQIPNFIGYKITKDGRIWSKPKLRCRVGKWLKPDIADSEHCRVTLYKNGRVYRKLVHRLVLETYIGKCPIGYECRHLDGNPKNNRLKNLCWGTRSENSKDAIKHGTHPGLKTKGESHSHAKLTEQNVRMIIYLSRIDLFTQREIADIYDISEACVSNIVHKKAWKHIWAEKEKLEI